MKGKIPNGVTLECVRPRRRRINEAMRRLARETHLAPSDLIYPLFVTRTEPGPIDSMPGVSRLRVDEAVREAGKAAELGVAGILLFGIPQAKDADGHRACRPEGVVPATVRAIKDAGLDIVVITDVCLCAYITHGQCGVLTADGRDIDNDPTLEVLARMACAHADSGADIVAPSAMMDHQVRALRQGLDDAGHTEVSIMSYSAKYASAFYGPFRDAASGAPQFGDRRTHQMDPCNAGEAVREAMLDVTEGADFIMVKPAWTYLDIIQRIKRSTEGVPLVAYNVSGEYAMLKVASHAGMLDERQAVLEVLHSIRRAGADLIITYYALDVARWLHM